MDARNELLAYLGAALVTIVGLFGLQSWYASYIDVAVVHALPADTPLNEKVVAIRAAEQQKLSGGRKPIDEAKRALAGGARTNFAAITPKPSDDLTPMSGWINRPGFKAYEPRQPQVQAAPAAAAAEGEAADQGAAAPAEAAPAQPAAAQPANAGTAPALRGGASGGATP